MTSRSTFRLTTAIAVLLAMVWAAAGCAGRSSEVPQGVGEPDKFLYDRGMEALEKKRWLTAREYFRRILDSYPQSQLRPDAKLGIADSFQGEGTIEGYILAVNEYREFLTFFPTSPRADYAQFQLGMTHFRQMRKPQRDQTETREAIREFEFFIERYPNSSLRPEVEEKLREAKDRLGEAEFLVGRFYYRQKWYPGAIDRFKDLLARDPQYTYRDGVYYLLGESLLKVRLDAEALPYFDKLVKEFEESEYLDEARARVAELKATIDTPPAEPSTDPPPAAPTEAADATPPPPTPR
jgi:outer membrane protein assembly factor BamD